MSRRPVARPGLRRDVDMQPLIPKQQSMMIPPSPGFTASDEPSRDCGFLCFACADESSRVCVQRFGRLEEIRGPGLHLLWWPFQTAAFVSIQVRQLDVVTDTKTKDNVSVRVSVALQYSVDPDRVDIFFFRLNDPERQMSACVEDSVRSFLPTVDLDEAFLSKDEMTESIRSSVARQMDEFGVEVIKALVTNMSPDAEVLKAMNETNAAKRLRVAAVEVAEAKRLLVVKRAEADAEAMHLSGIGSSKQRRAIAEGFKGAVHTFGDEEAVPPREVVLMMLAQQYIEVISDFASRGPASFLPFLPPTPNAPPQSAGGEGCTRDSATQMHEAPHTPARIEAASTVRPGGGGGEGGEGLAGVVEEMCEMHPDAAARIARLLQPENTPTASGLWEILVDIQKDASAQGTGTAAAAAGSEQGGDEEGGDADGGGAVGRDAGGSDGDCGNAEGA